jgi:phosphatidylglycerol---prolipoprotein diacylglyceryl transferase
LSFETYSINIGPLQIHYYALILITGMIAAAWLTARRAKAQGLDPEHVWNGLIWAIIPGLIGARIYHILTPSPSSGLSLQYYLNNPLQMLDLRNGGLGIFGGLIGGGIGVYLYARRHKQPLLKWFDLIVPGVALAQAIGRWGNFVNHELYGAPTTLPWATYIPPNKRLPGFTQYETFHPLFLYESLWNLASCGLLLLIERRFRERLRDGDIFFVYLILYSIGRFVLDFLRLDSNGFGPITTAQLVSLAVISGSLALLVIRHRLSLTPRQKLSTEQRRD